MISRYDYMLESKVKDVDNVSYPDPLSISFNDVLLVETPYLHEVTYPEICKPWTLTNSVYGTQQFDDILFGINGIPYIGMLKTGDRLFIVGNKDLVKFNVNKLKGQD